MSALYWVRCDLRIIDNPTLSRFYDQKNDKVAVWCPSKSSQRAKKFRSHFIEENLKSHSHNLKALGMHLHIEKSSFIEYLIKNHPVYKFTEVYFTSLHSTEEREEEAKVLNFCREHDIKIFTFDQQTLIEEKNLPFSLESMPFIFTDFRKKCEGQLHINPPLTQFSDHCFDEESIGEGQALLRLKEFIWETKAIVTYKETRNGMLDFNDSSKLSPWLSLGALSPRKIYAEIKKFEESFGANQSTYWLFFELLWRDYFKFIAKKYGWAFFTLRGLHSKNMKDVNPNRDMDLFHSWCEGKTKEPFINANMNELNSTGFMSNRGRQNVASYLIHDLNLPWTWGAKYFEEHLIDYDPESNWGNWLYLSGRGTDPRSRVFNIKKQAQDYDPHGLYQKKWEKKVT